MSQKSIELILLHQLAGCLTVPIFILDAKGNLIFCNEPAEKILGFRFSETGEMSALEWSTIFVPQNENGEIVQAEQFPPYLASTEYRMTCTRFYIRNFQNKICHIEVFTFPLVNQIETLIGYAALFQEIS